MSVLFILSYRVQVIAVKKDKSEKQKSLQPKKSVEQELLEKKCAEYEDMLKRLQAEFENFRKRCERVQALAVKSASQDILTRLLPFLDSFESALNARSQDEASRAGLQQLYRQLTAILSGAGLRPIESMGKRFNPYWHEAVLKESNPDIDDEIVTGEIQKGYMLNETVLRHSKVRINQKEQEHGPEPEEEPHKVDGEAEK